MDKPKNLGGELWGGAAAMLVALPSAIAYGVTIFSPFGGTYAAQGAIAGMLGAIALGLVAPAFGGTSRLITAPCAPAAAVLAALAINYAQQGIAPQAALTLLVLVTLLCGVLQLLFGFAGLGRLIKYMPYPVVSGYLTGVGLIIILGQVPRLLGAPKQARLWEALSAPASWQWQALAVGGATMLVMLAAPRLTRRVPAAILGLAAGVATYFAIAAYQPAMLQLDANPLVVGTLGGSGGGLLSGMVHQWKSFAALDWMAVNRVLVPALTLAVLLSIDTLKTCVVIDALTRSRHDSNRELIGQGLGNLACGAVGGVPGAGTMGATVVNISSGAQTRLSGVIEGVLALLAFVLLGRWIAWVPIAALAGILIVIAVRMFDRQSVHWLKARATALDFAVSMAVVLVALTVSLVAASAVGVALAILLFVREQVGGSVIRRKTYGNHMFSKQARLPEEAAILEARGERTVIVELQGSLFFGTADQLYTELQPELGARKYVILDMRRVQSVDVTAAHVLEQVEDMLTESSGHLLYSHLPRRVPSGQDMHRYFDQVGLAHSEHHPRVFAERDEALQWAEDQIIQEARLAPAEETLLELRDIELFRDRKEETLAALAGCLEPRHFAAGECIFERGDSGDELFLIRRGAVRIILPVSGTQVHHLATFARGDFFGEMAFLDNQKRSATALAYKDTELYALSRSRFDRLGEEHAKLAITFLDALARTIAIRLRRANAELRILHDA